MNLYTEKEIVTQNEQFIFRLRNLYKNDNQMFHQFKDFINIPYYINDRKTFNYSIFSDFYLNKGKEIENLYELGHTYLPKISEPILFDLAKKKAQKFHLKDDKDAICSYLQCISLNGKMTHFISNKCIIDENITINTSLFPDQMSSISKLFATLLPESKNSLIYWQRFQTLTKQEKIILKMIAEGKTSKTISEELFLSKHTVIVHRKNIHKKLEVSSLADLIKFSMVLELL